MASRALNWAVREMERRYRLLEEAKVKSFDSYNIESEEKMPVFLANKISLGLKLISVKYLDKSHELFVD